jgi:acetylornithine deacetylase/succinyl-diaminopimelate desuccinylase-like protein
MRYKTVFILIILFLWLILGCQSESIEAKDEKNDLILKALGFVSQENIYKTVEELQNFGTRYSWEKQDEVANYLFKRFQKYGIPVEFDEYYYKNKRWKNVLATIHGKRKPEDIYIVIAHFDSISKEPDISAPGADDNASGTAAVLEIGRILREISLNATVKLEIFSNEEQGLEGSRHFAKKARKKGLNIKGVINLDAIGFNDPYKDKGSEIKNMQESIKLELETIKNHLLNSAYPDGVVVIAGRPPNRELVETASVLTQKYSKLKAKERVGKDCG